MRASGNIYESKADTEQLKQQMDITMVPKSQVNAIEGSIIFKSTLKDLKDNYMKIEN